MDYKIILSLLCLCFLGDSIFADQIILQNGHNGYTGCTDTYIKIEGDGTELYPFYYYSNNYDTSITVETSNDDDCGGTYTRALYKFDLSSLSVSSDSITKVTFSSYFIGGFQGVQKTYLYRMIKGWKSDETTWLTPKKGDGMWNPLKDTLGQGGTFTEEDYAETACAAPETWEEYDITEITKFFIDNPDSNYGFIVISDKEINNIQRLYYSSDYPTDTSLRPKLTIEDEIAIKHVPQKILKNKIKFTITHSAINFVIPYTRYFVTITDAQGRTVESFRKNGKNCYEIPVRMLSTGVHFLNINHDHRSETIRFIVVK